MLSLSLTERLVVEGADCKEEVARYNDRRGDDKIRSHQYGPVPHV
jgi:hypothetical protein